MFIARWIEQIKCANICVCIRCTHTAHVNKRKNEVHAIKKNAVSSTLALRLWFQKKNTHTNTIYTYSSMGINWCTNEAFLFKKNHKHMPFEIGHDSHFQLS